jgi:hypothetical protein
MVSDTKEASVLYDPTKFVLGRLCKQGHDFDGQGHSLRYLKGDKDCVQCRQARSARNASKRSAGTVNTARHVVHWTRQMASPPSRTRT